MPRTALRLLVALLCSLLVVTSTNSVAEARKKKGGSTGVYGITRVSQDWPGARLLVKWRPVKSATYQMRVAGSTANLSAAPLVSTGTASGTWTGALDRGRSSYLQVRAVRGGKAGPWSAVRTMAFQNPWPSQPRLTGGGGAEVGQVAFGWGATSYTSAYRLETDGAVFGKWPGAQQFAGGWLPATRRGLSYTVPAQPGPGDRLLAVAYGNPVFARLEAHNRFHPSGKAYRLSDWEFAYPTPPAPAPGDQARVGAYNMEQQPVHDMADLRLIADNITARDLDVVLAQELSAPGRRELVSLLGARGQSWSAASAGDSTGQQLLFRNTLQLDRQGTFDVTDFRRGGAIITPWAQLRHRSSAAGGTGRAFVVSSIHFTTDDALSQEQENRQTGLAARQVMAAIDRVAGDAPVIVGGDLRYGREPFTEDPDVLPAQPTFVRSGFYDTLAAQRRVGTAYSTFNGHRTQAADKTGVGPRPDHILVRGFQGARLFQNVYNYAPGGRIPSDHNLLLADLSIPFS